MKKAKLFTNGRSQAVRLPKEFRFDDNEVYVEKVGNVVKLIPAHDSWDNMFESLEEFSPNFMQERNQPDIQIREDLFE